jgi:hypothetical protein
MRPRSSWSPWTSALLLTPDRIRRSFIKSADARVLCALYAGRVATENDFGYQLYDVPVDPSTSLTEVVELWLRHQVVLALRREMAAHATPPKVVAEWLGDTVGHFRKKLAGTAPFRLDDLVNLTIAFGPTLWPRFDSDDPEAMFPPAYRGRLRWLRNGGIAQPLLVDPI